MAHHCYEKLSGHRGSGTQQTVHLTFDERCRSRGKCESDTGMQVAWFFERGAALADGDVLHSESGELFDVRAACEPVSRVTTDDPHRLMRIAYHLGNRHVALQILPGELRYQPDHVLDEMVRLLGGQVERCELAFQPEEGAYSGQGHTHHPGHSHGDSE